MFLGSQGLKGTISNGRLQSSRWEWHYAGIILHGLFPLISLCIPLLSDGINDEFRPWQML